jgi:diguanylate cyclase (GGDEF)-like protein
MRERWIMKNLKEIQAAVSILLILSFFFVLFLRIDTASRKSTIDFSSGWDISYNGKIYRNQDLKYFRFPKTVKRGEKISISNVLPESAGQQMALSVLVYLSAVDIRLNEKMVYSYGFDLLKRGEMVGSAYHTVRLPESSGRGRVSVDYIIGENNAFTKIPGIHILPSIYAYTAYNEANILTMFVSIFLVGIGVISVLIALAQAFLHRSCGQLLLIGLFSFFMGTWSTCTTKISQYFSRNYQLTTTVEYLSLYIALIQMLCVLMYNNIRLLNFKRKVLAAISIMSMIFFLIIAVILHVLNIVHVPQALTIFHSLAVISLILVISSTQFGLARERRSETIMLHGGLWLIFFCCILDVVRFNLLKYVLPDNSFWNYSLLPYGTALFIVMLLSGYLMHLHDEYIDQAERLALTQIAYTDVLTGLYNRAYANQRFKELAGRRDYILISMDVNGLKRVNDTYGHAAGDQLIVSCGQILKECFGDVGHVFRMGGDEFMVLVEYASERVVKRRLDHMNRVEKEFSHNNSSYQIRISYGMASGKEFPETEPERIFYIADQRMYEMKKETKRDVR